jgi:3-methyladenine DNA glycosylase AlkD
MTINALKNEIIKKLKAKSDPKRKESAKLYYPTKMKVLGVKVPDLKKVLKDEKPEINELSEKEKIKLVKELIKTDIFECQQFGFEIINTDKKLLPYLTEKDAKDMKRNMDNWVSVDYYSGIIFGPLWREGVISDDKIVKLAKSKDFWERRIAVVSTVALNQKARGGTGDTKRTIKICKLVIKDENDMVQKALSWALRELAKFEKKPVVDFMKKYDDVLLNRVKREVGNKLKTGKKNK